MEQYISQFESKATAIYDDYSYRGTADNPLAGHLEKFNHMTSNQEPYSKALIVAANEVLADVPDVHPDTEKIKDALTERIRELVSDYGRRILGS